MVQFSIVDYGKMDRCLRKMVKEKEQKICQLKNYQQDKMDLLLKKERNQNLNLNRNQNQNQNKKNQRTFWKWKQIKENF